MFAKHSENGYISVLEGIWRKTTVHGDKTLMAEFLLKKELFYRFMLISTSRPVILSKGGFVL